MISKTGLVCAVLYVAAAAYLIYDDRNAQGGGWINLHGMLSGIATLPAAAVCELLGLRPDYKSNLHMGVLVAICAGLVYWLVSGAQKLFTKFFG